MTYLTRLSFLSDGASGSDVYDGSRHVGWVHPGAIGLCALTSETTAIVAAELVYRELGGRRGENGTASAPSAAPGPVVQRIGEAEWVTSGGIAIARLYRPKRRGRRAEPDSAYAIEFPMYADAADRRYCDSPRQAWRAAYAAVRTGFDDVLVAADTMPHREPPRATASEAVGGRIVVRSVHITTSRN